MTAGLLLLLTLAVPQLQNPSFEAAASTPNKIPGWQVSIRKGGAAAAVRADHGRSKNGTSALLVESREAADVKITQPLFLPVGSTWKASVWVKTENLSGTAGDGLGGQLVLDTPAGAQGTTAAQPGNSAWRQEQLIFRVPSPGRVRLMLIGLANATGKVWFDNVQLEEYRTTQARDVRISFTKTSQRPIDLKQGGQFIEPLCNLLPSMLAQQVESTSFEEEPAWIVSYKREIDKLHRPWYPDGAVHVATYSLDRERPFNGKRSQKIELPVARARAGISQDGFRLTQGASYRLRLHLRGAGNVPVWASLKDMKGFVTERAALGRAGEDWQAAAVVLQARRSSANATLNLEFEGPGTLWLDRIYLIGEDAVLGLWRPDVVQALKAMKPGVVRFGGSTMEIFEWDKCLGPSDTRVPYVNGPWGGIDPNFVGVEEFIQLCRHIGAEPLVCVRWSGKQPEDAAAEVEYFNGGTETHWGRLRAKYGHPEPYGVKYWQIGNEVGGGEYDASVRAFAEAMRRVDPSIKILSSFPSTETLRESGGYLDYLCPHHYSSMALREKQQEFDSLQAQIAKYSQGKDVRVAVTEWNTTAGDWGLGRGMLLTLGNALACSRYQNLLHRYADLVEITIRSNLVDSFGSGVIQPGSGWIYLAPTYYSQQLYQHAASTYPLRVERADDLPWELAEPDLSATLDAEGKTLRIYAVNSTAEPEEVQFHLDGFPAPVAVGKITVLRDRDAALDSEVMNSWSDPRRITPASRAATIRGKQFGHRFEPFSVTLLELRLQPVRAIK